MGSINFNNFKNTNYSQKRYTYTDMFLDLTQEPHKHIIERNNSNNNERDMKVAYDMSAIRNSITNLFNTIPGERILLPDYGCDLRRYVFEQISESNARFIGRTIKRSIEQWEPRVVIINIGVDAYIDEYRYEIALTMEVPFLQTNEKFNLSAALNRHGFTVI